jgi:translation elongation factor EF-G
LKHLSLGLLVLCPALAPGQEKANPDAVKPQERLTGMWRGWYQYPQGTPQAPVCFQMALVQDGSTVVGFIKEPNTFGSRREPWLVAVFKGRFDEQAGKLTFTKTYDGTAGPNHDVEYGGTLDKDGNKVEGDWNLGGAGGTFTLERIRNTRSSPFAGVWSGTYHYPKDQDKAEVKFQMIMVQHGNRVTGFIKEANTSGANKDEPYLHAAFKGLYDNKTGKLRFLKTYDGTAGEDHDVNYSGKVSCEKTLIEGTWTLPAPTAGVDALSGRFTLRKLRLDGKTVDSLK